MGFGFWGSSSTITERGHRSGDRPLRSTKVGQVMPMRLGIPELLIILFIVVLIFGANRLPELGRGIGKGLRNFKDATTKGGEEAEKS